MNKYILIAPILSFTHLIDGAYALDNKESIVLANKTHVSSTYETDLQILHVAQTAEDSQSLHSLKTLLSEPCNVKATDHYKHSTALHLAAQRHELSVELLLNSGWHLDQINDDGDTPLMCAIQSRRVECVGILLKRGANPYLKNRAEKTALLLSLIHSEVSIAQLLVDAYKDPSTNRHIMGSNASQLDEKLAESKRFERLTSDLNYALFICSRFGNTESCDWLIEQGARIPVTTEYLSMQAEDLHPGIVKLLLPFLEKEPTNVKERLDYGALMNDVEFYRLLRKERAPDKTTIRYACLANSIEIVQEILADKEFSLLKALSELSTDLAHDLFYITVSRQFNTILTMLIAHCRTLGVNPAIYINRKILCNALEKDDLPLFKILVDAGADVNTQDGVPLLTAIKFCRKKLIKEVLKTGAKIPHEAGDIDERFAKAIAYDNDVKLLELLLKEQALRMTEKNKASLLQMAIKYTSPKIVDYCKSDS